MKKLIITLAFGIAAAGTSSVVFAAVACTGTAGSGTAVTGATDGTKFVQVGFTPKCSANTLVDYTDQVTSFAVAAGSKKGKSTFIGNTAGGAVAKSGGCPSSGCTATELGTALTAAEALGST